MTFVLVRDPARRALHDRIAASGAQRRSMSSIEASPPEAMTGIETAFASAMVPSQLMPWSMPSRAMSV